MMDCVCTILWQFYVYAGAAFIHVEAAFINAEAAFMLTAFINVRNDGLRLYNYVAVLYIRWGSIYTYGGYIYKC